MIEVRRLTSLAWPVVLGQLGLVGMGSVDLLMIGGLGRDATAAVGLGNTWSFSVLIVALGAATGIDPLVTQAYGAGSAQRAGVAASRGLLLVAALSVPVVILHLLAAPALSALGQPGQVVPGAALYARILSISVLPMLSFSVIRQLLQGGGSMRPAMWVVGLGNLVNVVGNLALIERHGVAGVAWSTVIVRWVMLVGLIGVGYRQLLPALPIERIWDLRALRRLAALALPVGLQVGLEVWAFNAGALIAGWISPGALAAHTAAINAIALAFMVPYGISAAAATRVGNLVGARADWRPAARSALALGASVMVLSGLIFALLPGGVARAYNPDPEVVALVTRILPIGAMFGLFDAVQVVSFGILRGLGDTRRPALFNVLGYWIVGLPLGTFLALGLGLGLPGVWIGLALALALISGLLVLRIVWHGRAWIGPAPDQGQRGRIREQG